MKSGIYKITSPSGKIYIGQSVNLQIRLKKYKNKDCKTQTKLFNSIVKYGVGSHDFKIIEYCEVQYLNQKERYWQEFYNCVIKGLNCRLTKTSDKSGSISEETKIKLHILNKGKIISEEVKIKMSLSKKGIKSHRKGKKLSNITKLKMSKSQMKPVSQFTLNGIFIKNWDSALTASTYLNLRATHIRACCRGNRKSTGGFKWTERIF